MVAGSVKMPMLPVPVGVVTLVLSKPVKSAGVPQPRVEDCYGCVDWYVFEEQQPEPERPAARPVRITGH
jgi:hypothetical protein